MTHDPFRTILVGKQALAEAVAEEPHTIVGPVTDKLMRRRVVWTSETPRRCDAKTVWCADCLHEVEPNHYCGPCAYCEGDSHDP
jgi:hypothetical protein